MNRTVGIVFEHANRVFDTFEVSHRYMEALFEEVSDRTVEAREKYYSDRLRVLVDQMPQLRDLWVVDGNGHPQVSGTVFPMPRNLDLSDRDYFKAHKESADDTFVSEVVDARAANTSFFAVTRKRPLREGRFDGVYLVSIAPEYFTDFYAKLPRANVSVAALIRDDGSVLARYPFIPGSKRVSPSSAIIAATRLDPDGGFTEGVSQIDGVDRLLAYRLMPKYGVYVTAGLDTREIRNAWLRAMASHLVFGIPATLAMFSLAVFALIRTRQEANAYRQLREEAVRRHATELALQQSQKMEAVGQLTGGIAHDFNNLLTIIAGNLDTMRRRLSDVQSAEPTRELATKLSQPLERAIIGAKSAAQLTHRLLAFSRRQPLKPDKVDLNALVASLSELLRRSLGEGVNIETVLAGGLWPAFADQNQVENAVLNLAINARDAMPNGGRLTIETANVYLDEAYARQFNEVNAGQYVMISVTDSGTGIPPDVLEKVFEPFFTTKPVGQGSGLGLAMVHGFVKQSGGHIRIYSELEQGTTVKIYLPRLNGQETTSATPTGMEPPLLPLSVARDKEAILLVEDNDGVREYATTVLSELGYTVFAARDGQEALAIVDREPHIDLLFTDVVLPGDVNGRELANRILEKRPGLPVLYTTGYTRNAIIHHGRLDADVQLLGKPYAQQDLASKLRELLDKSPLRPAAPTS